MSVYIDRKYLMFISSRMSNFTTKKEDLYNFRCPYCGDSQKNKNKSRGYVYRKDNDYFYRCHNCGLGTTFGKFLEFIDAGLYKEYIFERYANGDNNHSPVEKPVLADYLPGPKPEERFRTMSTIVGDKTIQDLPDGHYAKEYIRNRRIPKEYWSEFVYTEKFRDFLNTNFPEHDKVDVPNDARIVMFYTDKRCRVTNVAGRALAADNQIRYITVKVLDERKVFGLHRLDRRIRVYITEGQFDSLFLPNAVACGDSNLLGMADYLRREHNCDDIVLIYDNQPRNKDIVKQINRAVENGTNVVFLPYDPETKDLNEMIKSGVTITELKSMIDSNVYSGLAAQLKLKEWRKC